MRASNPRIGVRLTAILFTMPDSQNYDAIIQDEVADDIVACEPIANFVRCLLFGRDGNPFTHAREAAQASNPIQQIARDVAGGRGILFRDEVVQPLQVT